MGTDQKAVSTDRLVTVTLDPNTITSINPDEVHEWRIAIYDLLESNSFKPARVSASGPFALHVSIIGNSIVLDVRDPETFQPIAAHYLSLTPFRRLIRDYFRIRDAYYEAIRSAQPFQIETVDMARRGMHNEAAELLRTRLTNKLIIDLNTARRLFTRPALCLSHRRSDERAAHRPFCLLHEFGALAHRGSLGPPGLSRPHHYPLRGRSWRQGRPVRARGHGRGRH
jgi:uncharacterized protein (UPF0262 family)